MIGVVAALPLEARCLVGTKIKAGERVFLDATVCIQVSGIGRERALRAAQSLLGAGAGALLSWGVAGGLAADFAPGTLVLPQQIIDADRNHFPTDEAWRERIHARVVRDLMVSEGALVEGHSVVGDPSQKQKLAQTSGAVAVDMESAAIAQAARQAGVPFVAVRVVVDTADMGVPRSAIRATDEFGRLHIARLLFSLLTRPADLSALIRLGQGFRAAQATLKTTARLAGPELCLH